MTRVTLEYCVPCGFRERALNTQAAILTSLEREIDAFELVTGDHGVFRVAVDGETVYDKDEDDLSVDGIVREVRQEL
jgi:selenoprotein W-related protein